MIGYLEGRLVQVWENNCLVITEGGVGYTVALTGNALASLPDTGGTVCLYTSLVVREDALELYGFISWDERQTFGVLVGISKVGAKTALAILTTFRPDDLRRLVVEEDITALTRVSGIGKKTAQHIFLELKYKLGGKGAGGAGKILSGGLSSAYRDALDALLNLGYQEDEAAPVVQQILREEPDLDVTALLRAALKQMAKGRS